MKGSNIFFQQEKDKSNSLKPYTKKEEHDFQSHLISGLVSTKKFLGQRTLWEEKSQAMLCSPKFFSHISFLSSFFLSHFNTKQNKNHLIVERHLLSIFLLFFPLKKGEQIIKIYFKNKNLCRPNLYNFSMEIKVPNTKLEYTVSQYHLIYSKANSSIQIV